MKNIPEQVRTALKMLSDAGFEAHIVGGCVRDFLLMRTPNDYDITTNALPEETREVFRNYRCIDVGIKHGTAAVIIDGMQLEITTYRIDGDYKDKRHPESVSFSSELKDDLSRRDFTINAMACDINGNITDCFGGKEDLKNNVIRCVGNPAARFDEDALRIMRAVRFASQLGFSIDEETRKSIFSLKDTLLMISAERLREELDKLLCGKAVYEILTGYHDVLSVFIPEISQTVDFEQHSKYHSFTVWEHTARAVMNSPCDKLIRLTMLLHDISKPETFFLDKKGHGHFKGHPEKGAEQAGMILRRLKYDNKTTKSVTTLIRYHDTEFKSRQDIKKVMSAMGTELFFTLIDIQHADSISKKETPCEPMNDLAWVRAQAQDIIAKNECLSISGLDINGNDLKEAGFSGAQIGRLLNAMLEAVIEDRLENSFCSLIKYAEAFRD